MCLARPDQDRYAWCPHCPIPVKYRSIQSNRLFYWISASPKIWRPHMRSIWNPHPICCSPVCVPFPKIPIGTLSNCLWWNRHVCPALVDDLSHPDYRGCNDSIPIIHLRTKRKTNQNENKQTNGDTKQDGKFTQKFKNKQNVKNVRVSVSARVRARVNMRGVWNECIYIYASREVQSQKVKSKNIKSTSQPTIAIGENGVERIQPFLDGCSGLLQQFCTGLLEHVTWMYLASSM